ncbi:hypothetical protein ACCD06_26650 [Azospirillum sp. CT11-132]|uniref:hypothetical protein n=1 Tax=Azospirillum sp. CT11-132 TaxID=3396317 RepID=UPI0039A56E2C
MPISTAGRAGILLALACSLPLLASCQTVRRPYPEIYVPSAIYAQQRGWLVERYTPTNPGAVPYCVASKQSPAQELAFIATRTNTGLSMNKTGVPVMATATYPIEIVFDSGNVHHVQAKPGGFGMLIAPLGGPEVGAVLSRFASAGTVALAVPGLGIRKLYDLDGSSWAIGKLSECIGAPSRTKHAPTKPAPGSVQSGGPSPSGKAPSAGPAPQLETIAPETPASAYSPAPAPAQSPAPAAPASGGIDLDMQIDQPIDLDEPKR